MLDLEKNLAKNSVASYRNDLNSFINFMEQRNISDLSEVTHIHINRFFKMLNDMGLYRILFSQIFLQH